MEELNAGWGWPPRERKAHYYEEDAHWSLCSQRKFFGPRQSGFGVHKDYCEICLKKLEGKND